jgi:hypothetical protein
VTAAARRVSRRGAVRPVVGTVWAWEPEAAHAAALIRVTGVRWNGEEWYVGTEALGGGRPAKTSGATLWNDLSRFWEACHAVAAEPGPGGRRGLVRRGAPRPDEVPDD